ncbi:hypothetical protein TNCV_1779651 [Trichonephila clavipes]|nr:hypothetical protein TNCV_1779651 [Trichonephila clavipes]
MNMNRYTNTELVDIHFTYSLTNGNRRVAVRLYGERYPTGWQLKRKMFAGVHGSFKPTIDNTPINSEMIFVAGTSITAATIREIPSIFEHVC